LKLQRDGANNQEKPAFNFRNRVKKGMIVLVANESCAKKRKGSKSDLLPFAKFL